MTDCQELIKNLLYTPWTKCSKSCGGGVKTRNQSCLTTQFDGTNQTCDKSLMETEQCNTEDCPHKTGEWRQGDWTSCSVTCGNGTKQR